MGAPRELYDRPVNLFVAAFIGAPPINLLPGALRPTGQGVELELAGARIVLPPELIQRRLGLMAYQDREIIVGVRPEAAWRPTSRKPRFRAWSRFRKTSARPW